MKKENKKHRPYLRKTTQEEYRREGSATGITLIVLIITIIIMLILVAVVIDIAIDGKLIDSAKEAVEGTNDKVSQTQTRVDELMGIMNDIQSGQEQETGDLTVNFTIEGTYPEVSTSSKVARVVDGVPIPQGFYYVGGDKDTGLVISDSSSDENDGVDANLSGNQFVWVPVKSNQKIKLDITSEENIESITLKDPWNVEMEIPSSTGKTYSVDNIDPTINGLYTVTVEAGENTVTKTLRVSSLYAQDFWLDYCVEDWFWSAQGYESLEDMLDEYESDQGWLEYVEWCENCTDSTIATYKNSVNTYGGFYIGRYEAGNVNNNAVCKKNQTPYKFISQTTAIIRANMYRTSTSVTSCLINSAAWDRTLNWLVETNAITKAEMFGDSSSWGNYYNNSISEFTTQNNSTLLNTGITDYTKKNNIYDLAGNLAEWSTEADSSGNVVFRGGHYTLYGFGPAASRGEGVPSVSGYDGLGFRPTLYVNLDLK